MSDPHAERPSPPASRPLGAQPSVVAGEQDSPAGEHPSRGEPGCANAAHPDDALRRWQRDEILRLQRGLQDEIESILQELARERDHWG